MCIQRNFFEQELRKLFDAGDVIQKPVFICRYCLGRLDANLLVKLEFVCSKYASNYDALQIELFLADLLEVRKLPYNFNFPGGEAPYIWVDRIRAEWYAVKPTEADYAAIRKAVQDYLNVFREVMCA